MLEQGVFVVASVPECGGERLLNFEAGYRGSPRREAFYRATRWAIDLLRELHQRILAAAAPADSSRSPIFYVPTFFGLLMAIHDAESLSCLSSSIASLAATRAFKRNAGYDHFYLHGLEQPIEPSLDYAEGGSRRPEEVASGLIHAVYSTLQNVAVVATGDLLRSS
eukprot:TRINITY_DN15004_c0_g1_i4.p1 TRINITY_DN15004_c0_g1~~TRINITY_DN15004_c0_g1_i4.p1  ORF type:complete len:166 (+),score=20.44 TRINITY_DN15004_c0_g1_i4:158-655(+)